MKRGALYLRVSTDDQTTDNQRPELERMLEARGLSVVQLYEETASGAARRRPEFERMMKDAKAHRFDALLVWSLDRLGRSMVGNMETVLELDRLGIVVISVREAWLDTGGAPGVRQLLIAIFSWLAEQERTRLVERTLAGMARARRKGVHVGRPRVVFDLERARSMREDGATMTEISKVLRVRRPTLIRAMGKGSGE